MYLCSDDRGCILCNKLINVLLIKKHQLPKQRIPHTPASFLSAANE